mgnify:CR=1 FL=1
MDTPIDHEPDLASPFQIWPDGVAMAVPDLYEVAGVSENEMTLRRVHTLILTCRQCFLDGVGVIYRWIMHSSHWVMWPAARYTILKHLGLC